MALLILLAGVAGADQKEEPVGLVLSAGGSKLLRENTETALSARVGDLLFAGDGIRTGDMPASFLFCPAKSIQTLAPAGEVRLDARQFKVKAGKITAQPARACTLPQTLRVAVASQQHYGVTMTRGAGSPEFPPVPRGELGADVLAELAPLDAALAADPKDQAVRIALAQVFEKHGLPANALEIYSQVLEQWGDAVWIKSKIFELEETLSARAAAAAAASPAGGKTYALLVGISKYKKPELSLQFAEADASAFARLLQSPRGGGLPVNQILSLTDEKATLAAVRNGFQDFLKRRARKEDTVIVVIAGHGTVEVPGSKNAFILTYDSDPQDLASTALPMAELRSLFDEQLKNVGRVVLFVDVCKAGAIGTMKGSNTVNADVQNLGDAEGDLLGLLASRPKEVSREGPEFGGGHGVFSYFVLKGLDGAADENKDGFVDANELIKYVSNQVASATGDKQHPREFGTYDNRMRLSDGGKPGIEIAQIRWRYDSHQGTIVLASYDNRMRESDGGKPRIEIAQVRSRYDSRQGTIALASADSVAVPLQQDASDTLADFAAALQAGRLLPDQPGNAFGVLQRIQPSLSGESYEEASNQLRIALEDRAQEVLLRYLAGDQNPQTRLDFAEAARYMEAARTLTRESLLLEGRQDFFQGRTLLFDKRFSDAAALLEQSVRFDPGAAYGYNALGIAYLEQARFDQAIPAFRDAARRAPHWSYPLHNEALAYVETGDYGSAIRAYQEAIRLSPQYSYLPYNLGLVYQRLNRGKDAEAAYRRALSLAPGAAEPYNALGTLKASQGKAAEAEKLYREALSRNMQLLPARHNLALLLAQDKNRRAEAIGLWRENLQQKSDYLPSRLSLAETLAANGDSVGAIQEYRQVLALQPGYLGARLALAGLLAKTGDAGAALAELQVASRSDAQNGAIFEQIGDLESARGRTAEAAAAYDSARNLASDKAARKRIEGKKRALAR